MEAYDVIPIHLIHSAFVMLSSTRTERVKRSLFAFIRISGVAKLHDPYQAVSLFGHDQFTGIASETSHSTRKIGNKS